MFIAARFILGFGLSITSNAAPTLVIEIAHPSARGKITSLYNTMWYLGSSKFEYLVA
jgi:MFS family permease